MGYFVLNFMKVQGQIVMVLRKERFEKDAAFSRFKEKEITALEPKELLDVLSNQYVGRAPYATMVFDIFITEIVIPNPHPSLHRRQFLKLILVVIQRIISIRSLSKYLSFS
jgi:hypothetical protein